MVDDADAPESAGADRIAQWDHEVCVALMSTPQGRFFIERFLDYCQEGQELYREDGDALGMAKRDGLAKAGRWWRIQLEAHCPDLLLRMIRERRGRSARAMAEIKKQQKAAEPDLDAAGVTPVEEMADEQARVAAAEAARAEARPKPKKGR